MAKIKTEKPKEENEAKSVSVWASVIAAAVSLITYILQLIFGNKNSEVTISEKNKKLQEVLDDNKKSIKRAHETNNLEEIRKMLGK